MNNDNSLNTDKLGVAPLSSSRSRPGKSRELRYVRAFNEALQQMRASRANPKTGVEMIATRVKGNFEEEVEQALKERIALDKMSEDLGTVDETGTLEDQLPAATLQPISLADTGKNLPQAAAAVATPVPDPAAAAIAIIAAPQPSTRKVQSNDTVKTDEASLMEQPPEVFGGEQADQPLTRDRPASMKASTENVDLELVQPQTAVMAPASAVSQAMELDPATPTPMQPAEQKKIVVSVARVETAFLPAAALSTAQAGIASATVKSADVTAPAPVANQTMPIATVVKSIRLQLQPEHLGEVQLSLHLKGEGLRVTVEVATREAHALLQRDSRALRDVLEKAGYDVAEQAVTVTLRAEQPQPQPTAASNNDASPFPRGGQDQPSQHAGERQQSRQQQRLQANNDEAYNANQKTPASDRLDRTGNGGIYL